MGCCHDVPVNDPQPRRIEAAEAALAAEAIHAAFSAEEILRWAFDDDDRWATVGRVFVDRLVEVRRRGGEAWLVDGPRQTAAAVALWDPPGGVYAGRAGLWAEFNALLNDREAARLDAYDSRADAAQPVEPHWYLGVLAVAPSQQGRGYARRVVSPILEAADRTQTPVTLETASPMNVAIYSRFGFAVRTEFDLPDHGPHVWLLERAPR